jgi:molybdate transport system substrate-binding protein
VQVLQGGGFQHIAIADPATAPYGAAAIAVIAALGATDVLTPKLVTGQSISQALQFVDSGNAELGFVALSQVIGRTDGHQWLVPQGLYPPIVQDAVLLKTGADNAAAKDFLAYLTSPEGRTIIEKYGYETEME